MDEKYPGTRINYLDAGFPFIDGFPLLPHLSHNDGRKLDLAFLYTDQKNGEATWKSPSWTGYGVCEGPLPGETDMPARCLQQGYKKYDLLEKVTPQRRKGGYAFDTERNRHIIKLLAGDDRIAKIFIEPHLKERLGLRSGKIRFHG